MNWHRVLFPLMLTEISSEFLQEDLILQRILMKIS